MGNAEVPPLLPVKTVEAGLQKWTYLAQADSTRLENLNVTAYLRRGSFIILYVPSPGVA